MSPLMETHFKFDEAQMLHILGENNFPDIYSPFIELIKNAYDACLEANVLMKECNVDVDIEHQQIRIDDNGIGMNVDDLFSKWLIIGKSFKKDGEKSLIYQGDKGIGRIAIHKVAKTVKMFSQKRDEANSLFWTSDWNSSSYDIRPKTSRCGTIFILSDLRQKWSVTHIEKLRKVLSILIYYIPDFKLTLNGETIENVMPIEIINEDYDYLVEFRYDSKSKNVQFKLFENEFDGDILKSILHDFLYSKTHEKVESINSVITSFNYRNRLIEDVPISDEYDCGSFYGELIFRRGKTNPYQIQRFHYLNKNESRCDNGILIYRDNFIVRPFGIGGKNDFFDISGRVRRSPATQTKEDGRWRARLNNLTGFVAISKATNPNLVDQSNRNGFEENQCLDYFKVIVDQAIDFFEEQRQALTVAINKVNDSQELIIDYNKTLDQIVNRSMGKKYIRITNNEVRVFEQQRTLQEENEQNHFYDIKRMIFYTTQGLLTLSKYHEIKNQCDFIETFREDCINSIKDVGYESELKRAFDGKQLSSNLYKLIDKMQEINNVNASYSRKILEEEKPSTFESLLPIFEVIKTIQSIINSWSERKSKLTIVYNKDDCEGVLGKISLTNSDILSIFDNLILNSIQANKGNVMVKISLSILHDELLIDYSNEGAGLAEKFRKEPYKIFDYGTKGKEGGHGIGMWIVKKAIDIAKGKIEITKIDNGFGVQIRMPVLA